MLKSQLQKVSKGGDSIAAYLSQLKALIDQLAAVGESVAYRDHLAYLLEGLPANYDPFVSAVYNWGDSPSVEEIQSLLIAYELRLEKRNGSGNPILPEANSISVNRQNRTSGVHASPQNSDEYAARGRWTYSRGGRNGGHERGQQGSVKCQICLKVGHSTLQCYHRLNPMFQPQVRPQAHFSSFLPTSPLQAEPSSSICQSSCRPISAIAIWHRTCSAFSKLLSHLIFLVCSISSCR